MDKSNGIPIRVVVKLTEHSVRDSIGRAQSQLESAFPDTHFNPYFKQQDMKLRAVSQAPFNRYIAVEVRDRDSATRLAHKLQAHDLIEEAYVEGGPTRPPVFANDDPRNTNQDYLDAAPNGIDARWAWQHSNGSGVGFVGLEQGWTLDHEDLVGANITLISGVNQAWHGHGTAVLGEVVAVDNMRGGVGIAPGASARVVSQFRTATNYQTAEAILSAGQSMSRGDVLLLEAQTPFGSLQNLPVEVETAVFDAIRYITDEGIIVIEAAGNGGHDLDTFVNLANRQVLNRGSSDFRDSGAIMVGAASSTTPHSRLGFSCHGSRIDCYGWGENIDTAGDGRTGNLVNTYTASFGGTSGASPMIAGAALLLQSWRKPRSQPYSPEIMRDLLTSNLNTPSANPASDRVGVMPNLRAILEAEIENEKRKPIRDNYMALVYILFGIIDDSPGAILVPGKGPIPIDPDWHKRITAPKRDLIASLAVHEISRTVTDQTTRTKLNEVAIGAMRDAVERIARMP